MENKENIKVPEHIIRKLATYQRLIREFIYDMWQMTPQPVKPEYRAKMEELELASRETWERLKEEVGPHWFGDYDEKNKEWVWYKFTKGKHYTWQQNLILMGIEKGANGDAKNHLTIKSGHGIGKSATVSWIILWFLYCFHNSQVPVTAPTSTQMHDVLWKELSKWIGKLPDDFSDVFDWTSDYIRVNYNPREWFARARTSTKENTEAIAGVHAEHVLIAVDEASGVPEQVFNTAEGALTSGNVFVILISNPTRTSGYFYDSHHKNSADWQLFSFNCEESPVVDKKYVERQEKRHGRESDEFRIRVQGKFPKEEAMDDSGYMQLVPESKVTVEPTIEGVDTLFIGRKILGIDPSGEGKDTADFVVRDRFRAECVKTLATTNSKKIAEMALIIMDKYNIKPEDVVIDSFGVGHDVGKEMAIASAGRFNVYTVLVGNKPKDEEEYNHEFFRRFPDELDDRNEDIFLNIRALMYFRQRKWLFAGGVIMDSDPERSYFKTEVTSNKYKRSLQGNKIQLMPKKDMQKLRIPSPNKADALALTFLRDILDEEKEYVDNTNTQVEEEVSVDDKFSVV